MWDCAACGYAEQQRTFNAEVSVDPAWVAWGTLLTMKNLLLAALLCFPLVCCGDDGKSPSDQPDDTEKDAEAANSGEDGGSQKPSEGEGDGEDGGGGVSSPNDGGSARDGSTGPMDAGNGNKDGGTQPKDAAAQDARTNADTGTPSTESDAGVGGAPRCAGSGLKFCDDFENSIDPGWVDREGTLEIDKTNPAVRGQGSLHVRTTNNTPAIMAHKASFPMPNERFWVRTFVKIKNLPSPDWAHWSILWTIPQGQQWSVVEHRLGGQNQSDKKFYWAVGTDQGTSGDWTNIDTSSTVQLDKWICLETLIDANMDVSQVFRDGVEIPKLGTTRMTMHMGNSNVAYDIPPVRTLWLGFFYYQGETPGVNYEVWFDSFALDGERIGCSR